jgi:GWxTD domain-containing protein
MTDQQKKQRVEALQQESDRQMAAIRKEMESPYRKWLNEDVAYIITDAERKAFLSLTTDFDREQFIEQFWKRRDPTPDTERNEYKEEHYRRIAYANDHFKSGIPGWKTDRGRIYIGYGPPDEIDSHPSGGSYTRPAEQGGGTTSTYPFEKWRYRYIEGMGENIILEFVDGERNGEYRMTMDPTEKEKLLSSSQPPPLQIVQGIPSGPSDRGFGDKHAGVWIYPGGQVTLVIPLEGPGMNHIYARLKTAGGEVITYFEQDANPVNLNFVRNVVLKPGSYVFSAARMGRDGETEVVNFAVK